MNDQNPQWMAQQGGGRIVHVLRADEEHLHNTESPSCGCNPQYVMLSKEIGMWVPVERDEIEAGRPLVVTHTDADGGRYGDDNRRNPTPSGT